MPPLRRQAYVVNALRGSQQGRSAGAFSDGSDQGTEAERGGGGTELGKSFCGLIKIIEAINELQYYIDIEQLEDWQQEATIVYIEQYECGERNAQGAVSWLDTSQFVATDEEEEAAEDDAAEEEAEEAEEADEE
jgi:hypothetical protein